MYLPATFEETDHARMREWVNQHPLGLLISQGPSGLQASPLPFVWQQEGERITLLSHMARANPHWSDWAQSSACLVVFQGEQAYVSPSWYPTKAQTHQVVPTWNYAMVQMRGQVKVHTDEAWLHQQVSKVTTHMERVRSQPWSVQDAPERYVASQLKAIVGIEIDVTEVRGKWKMSQNRNAEDAKGVVSGLSDPSDPHANAEVAASVAQRLRQK